MVNGGEGGGEVNGDRRRIFVVIWEVNGGRFGEEGDLEMYVQEEGKTWEKRKILDDEVVVVVVIDEPEKKGGKEQNFLLCFCVYENEGNCEDTRFYSLWTYKINHGLIFLGLWGGNMGM
ncbi:hypothetical protein Tco_1555972 [Tanacetum coccineum]